ncbi:YjbQ family protein [Shewanella litorisediminis]|uniref:YjbQ family protein n=2 Tax=Shewanella litorisediminis TaxID=1173586 RepID=A0ABX7G8E4_9GAMM|nr:secondary thiamine-phosphate synthase enzyme YjbQ [Shewanella litorisediminis]MCL2919118.1 secondary thiamine-phosphate synthase enzyme YjbQ [Shewanella litorisediminis]QRH03621.1 YjbQ family protein [Shewanella litorisediminis]
MMWFQKRFSLRPKSRGFHLVTDEITTQLPELANVKVGLLHLQLLHTSASLSLNENADPTVRQDFESFFNRTVRENEPWYRHDYEGPDDMPAHLKSSLLGTSLMLAISEGRLALGTWQGIYLGEHRNSGGERRIIATLQGE